MQKQFITKFIENKRQELGIKAETLADGILKNNTLRKIENNEIYADKLLFDTILQRLGVGQDYFEHYITLEDFDLLQLRNDILNEIDSDNVSNANIKLDEYASKDTFKMSVHKQYYEYALTLIYKKENGLSKELLELYETTIKITVPKFKSKPISELLLSNWELFFILEYVDIMKQLLINESIDYYKEILEYLRKGNIEDNIKAIFYSFVALPIIESMLNQDELTKALELTNETIEILRKPFVLTNFTIMLDKKLELLDKLNLDQDNEKMAEWLEVLQEFYRDYSVNPNIDRLKYQVFNWYDCYIINDVIKIRRLMLGLTQAELSEDVCDARSISMIERSKSTPHPSNASLLLEKLNLSGQLYSFDVVTNDYDVFTLVKETNNHFSKCNYDIVIRNVELLKDKLNMKNNINLQYIKHKEVLTSERQSKLSTKQCYSDLIDVLEITIFQDYILKSKNMYLNNKELILVNNIMDCAEKSNEIQHTNTWLNMLQEYIQLDNVLGNSIYVSIFTLDSLSSINANLNVFDNSNSLIKKAINDSFLYECYWHLNNISYGIAWNYKTELELKRELTEKEQKKYMKLLRTSYILSDIKYDEYAKNFIKKQY